jgi:hypothetical protein
VRGALRPFCSETSRDVDEPLSATASRIDHWLLVEYRGLWTPNALRGSGLSDQVKARLREELRAREHTRLLFIRRPDRRGKPELLAYAASSLFGDESARRFAFEAYDDLREVDLTSGGEPVRHPLFVVCTHGKHDRCCARYGRPLFEALAEQLDDEWVWQSTHVGGDRFAGNVVCLPHGLYYGRVAREDAVRLVDEHLAGRLLLDRYRGRSIYSFAAQAAEQSVRVDESLGAIDALALRRVEGQRITFEDDRGIGHERVVEETLGEPRFLTCSANEERRPPGYSVRPS